MKIYPIKLVEADKKHWVVRWLRYDGYLICAAAVFFGIYYAYNLLTPYLVLSLGSDPTLTAILSMLAGAFVGFVAGLGISLPCWAISMAIDDLHALRLYASGLNAYEPKE